ITTSPRGLDQPYHLPFRPPLPSRCRRSIADAHRRVGSMRDFHAEHDFPERAPHPEGLMSHATAVLLFERRTPFGHHLERDRVGGDISPHIPNTKPSRPPYLRSRRQRPSSPFRRTDVDLKRRPN